MLKRVVYVKRYGRESRVGFGSLARDGAWHSRSASSAPPGSGKTSLFTALTKAGGGEYGKTNLGMAPIADERLDALAGSSTRRR